MVKSIEYALIYLSLEQVTVHASQQSLDEWRQYFADCLRSIRGFRPAALASPNPLVKHYYYMKDLYQIIYFFELRTILSKDSKGPRLF